MGNAAEIDQASALLQAQVLAGLRTPEGMRLPTNMIEEFRRDMARLASVREQISSIEKTPAERLERAPDTEPHAMVRLLARVIGVTVSRRGFLAAHKCSPIAKTCFVTPGHMNCQDGGRARTCFDAVTRLRDKKIQLLGAPDAREGART